ncbi:MAG: hypothetical protein A2V64_11800 [Bacteroidetes bacterium RBG_13_43_22]|nr:MAG: hypothetical protein A2V64_11800 [Bacteroidetes bacterium RBG_13_43_22]OFY74963.1 MAG: hypothetical protein A2V46_00330 [Bacteroidetes bacterium RBG_19FT_COMBO_42_7]
MPLRIDSECRKDNADTAVRFVLRYFKTTFIVLEGDIIRKHYPGFKHKEFYYKYLNDRRKHFWKTWYIRKLIEMVDTPFIAVWDADVIVPAEQIMNSTEVIRSGGSLLSIPYDGRVYKCDESLSDMFRRTPRIEILKKLMPALPLMYGYNSPGGAFMTDKEKYIELGGENLNFKSWGPEDTERIKRFEVLNLPVHRSEGPLFHLWHPRGQNSWYANRDEEISNRRELIRTCQKT